MADLDTRSKRASSVRFALAFMLSLPLPDGTISQGDRQHGVCAYSGILAAGAVVAVLPAADVIIGVRRDVGVIAVFPDVGVGARDVVRTVAVRADVGIVGILPDVGVRGL